jgi:hypothetical protein
VSHDIVIRDRCAVSILDMLDRDQWVESLRTLVHLAPDVAWEMFRILSWNRHGRVDVSRQFGRRDGGPF